MGQRGDRAERRAEVRVAEMKKGVEYSTCEGRLVVPVEPIHSNWYRVYDLKANDWKLVDGGGERQAKADPWGGCHTQRKGRPAARRTKAGVLVDAYDVDRNGRRIEGTEERGILPPADIVGTWREYLTLYADVVRERWDQKLEEETRDAAAEFVKAHIAKTYGGSDVNLSPWVNRNKESETTLFVGVTLALPVPKSRAKNPEPKIVRLARSLGFEEVRDE